MPFKKFSRAGTGTGTTFVYPPGTSVSCKNPILEPGTSESTVSLSEPYPEYTNPAEHNLGFFDFESAPRRPLGAGECDTSWARAQAISPSTEPGGVQIGRELAERKRAEWEKTLNST